MNHPLLLRHRSFCIYLLTLLIGLSVSGVAAQCPVPSGLFTDHLTATSVQANWSPATADSFLVRYRESGATTYRYQWVVAAGANEAVLDSLSPNTSYDWQVRAFCSGFSSAYPTMPAYFTTAAADITCISPNQLSVTALTTTSAELSWNSNVFADSFIVRYAVFGSFSFSQLSLSGADHSVTINGLQPATTYYWSISSYCNGVLLTYSPFSSFTTFLDSCDKPSSSSLTSSSITSSSATLSWSAVNGASGYTVRYFVSGSARWNTISSSTNQAVITRLRPNTTYEFQVQSVCPGGTSAWTSVSDFRTATVGVTVTRGPYIQQTSTNSTFIRWRTDVAADSRVSFGTAANNLNRTVTLTALTTEHVVQLTGLLPATTYFYSVGTSTQRLVGDTGYFVRTNPHVGSTTPTRIWATGDFGMASLGQEQVRDAYMNYCATTHKQNDLWLWLGDNAYSSGLDQEYQEEVFEMYPYQLRKFNCWPATGNHDLVSCDATNETGPYFENFTLPRNGEVGGLPSHTEAYYSFNYANIHFICLESTDASFRAIGGDMVNWLEQDLQSNRQRWTIVYFHHPPYSKGSHDSDNSTELEEMRTNIVPILENHHVDLVLSGHSHAYERSYFMHGHFGTESTFDLTTMAVDSGSGSYPASYIKSAPDFLGTVYVVCGVSGRLSATSSDWPHNAMYASTNALYGSMVIDITGDRLDCRFLTGNGAVWDEFTILKSGSQFLPYVDETSASRAISSGSPVLDVFLFPNPVRDDATVLLNLERASSVRVDVFDSFGRIIAASDEGEFPAGTHPFPVSGRLLPAGCYLIRIVASGYTVTRRFIVE